MEKVFTHKEIEFERINNGIVAETDEGKVYFRNWDDFLSMLTQQGKDKWEEMRHMIHPPKRLRVVFRVEEWNPPTSI